MTKEYEIVMGLEVHVELKTKTKIFCSCTTEFGGEQIPIVVSLYWPTRCPSCIK